MKRNCETGLRIALLCLCCCLYAACGSSSDNNSTDTSSPTDANTLTDTNVDDVDPCTNDVLDVMDGVDGIDGTNSCGTTGSGSFQVCAGQKHSKFASFTFSSLVGSQGIENLSVKSRNTVSGSDLTEQIAREDGYPSNVTIIRVWSSSDPGNLTLHTKAPQIGWTTATQPVPGEGNQLSLFPTYAKEILKCLGNADGLDKCSDKLTQTSETSSVGGQACTFFTFAGVQGIKICVPHNCDARSTLLPLKVITTVGGKTTDSTWAGLKSDSTVTDDDFKQN